MSSSPSENYDVFVSYPRLEPEIPILLHEALEREGLRVFRDLQELDAGDAFPVVIDRVLKSSPIVLGCWSPTAFTRDWVMKEQAIALHRGVLVPAVIKPVTLMDIRVDFQGLDYADLSDFDGEASHAGLQKLLKAIRKLKSGPKFGITSALPSDADSLALKRAIPEMIALPVGRFQMGAHKSEAASMESERPQRLVTFDYSFSVGKYPVTFEEWDAAIALGAPLHRAPDQGWGRSRRPVVNVSWQDAHAYITWLNNKLGLIKNGYRLLSEAEWEYACRAGTTTAFYFGPSISSSQANFDGSRNAGVTHSEATQRTSTVGTYPANAFGLFDFHGNVEEWCEDVWNASYVGAPSDGSAWSKGDVTQRILRGGAWTLIPQLLRSASRNRANPSSRVNYRGFRLARTLPAQS